MPMVNFAGNGDQVPGYLARPNGDGPFPPVVVIQEWWGLNDHIKDVANRLAAEGYIALAPDLYRGAVATEPDDARKLAMELDRPQAIKDIQGAVNYLVAREDVVPKQAGVIGFCMGGGLAAMMSYQGESVGAAVVFYGNVRDLLEDDVTRKVSAPLLGLFGSEDKSIPVDVVEAVDAKLKQHTKISEFHVYSGAPHAFFNDTRPHIYHEEAAKDAWQQTLDWLREYLS